MYIHARDIKRAHTFAPFYILSFIYRDVRLVGNYMENDILNNK